MSPADDEREALAFVVNRHLIARGWAANGHDIADVVLAAGFHQPDTTAEQHVVHVTATPIAEDVVWCEDCEEWVTSGPTEARP